MLLVEDDAHIREVVTRLLTERGHELRAAWNGREGLREVVDHAPDVVVLDLGLPDIDGRHLLKMIRSVSPVPVIVATARDDEAVIVATLDAGADDYVVKPFSAAQLDARIRALLRRSTPDGPPVTVAEIGGLRVDPQSRQASVDGVLLELTRKEFDLLEYLAMRVGRVVTKRELMAQIWQMPYGGADKTVDVHLSWLRRKLGESAAEPYYIRTARGVGVRLVDPAIEGP